MKELDYIHATLSDRDLLEQLAEEAAELGQAALKLIRAKGYTNNPTPVDLVEALYDLEEEFDDVLSAMAAYCGSYDAVFEMAEESQDSSKWQRWAKRIREGQE